MVCRVCVEPSPTADVMKCPSSDAQNKKATVSRVTCKVRRLGKSMQIHQRNILIRSSAIEALVALGSGKRLPSKKLASAKYARSPHECTSFCGRIVKLPSYIFRNLAPESVTVAYCLLLTVNGQPNPVIFVLVHNRTQAVAVLCRECFAKSPKPLKLMCCAVRVGVHVRPSKAVCKPAFRASRLHGPSSTNPR